MNSNYRRESSGMGMSDAAFDAMLRAFLPTLRQHRGSQKPHKLTNHRAQKAARRVQRRHGR